MQCVVGLGLGCASLTIHALDWPQWRGPNRDGISQEKGLLKEWPKEGPKLLWKFEEAGSGYSTPAVVGDRVYLLGSKKSSQQAARHFRIRNPSALCAIDDSPLPVPDSSHIQQLPFHSRAGRLY